MRNQTKKQPKKVVTFTPLMYLINKKLGLIAFAFFSGMLMMVVYLAAVKKPMLVLDPQEHDEACPTSYINGLLKEENVVPQFDAGHQQGGAYAVTKCSSFFL